MLTQAGGTEARMPTEVPGGAYWGRALRMAFTSSATAVSANSNWSCARPVAEGSGET